MFEESVPGTCGLASSASALVRFICVHAVWGTGPRMVARRCGSTPGARSAAVSRADDVDWVLVFDSRMGITDADGNAFIDELDSSLGARFVRE
jgi:hypothetical protein